MDVSEFQVAAKHPKQYTTSWTLTQGQQFYLLVKRLMDVSVSLLLLLVLAPLFLLVALVIQLSSPGPVFYRWEVVGEKGRPFTGFKFRTMVAGADADKDELSDLNEIRGPAFKIAKDPRITPVGRWLRRYSVDELPQLLSVLTGDMSLVGPRPPLRREYALFSDWHKLKLSVKPGLTCLWQVNGRNDVKDFDHWVEMDLDYIRRRSLWLDLEILWLTIPAILKGTGV